MDPASLFLFNPFMGVNASSTGYKDDRFAQLVASAGTEPDAGETETDLQRPERHDSGRVGDHGALSERVARDHVLESEGVRWRFNEVAVWSEVWLDA